MPDYPLDCVPVGMCSAGMSWVVGWKVRWGERNYTLGIDGLHTGMMLPDILFKFLLMNSSGLGPTTRWIKSMLFSNGGIAAVNVPKLFARVCMDTIALSNK